LFAFAGIWDRWKDEGGTWLETCSILTTTPNAVTSAVHDRMPVILDPDCYEPVARSGDEGCGFGVRTAKALRCLDDAVLSREHSGQSRGE